MRALIVLLFITGSVQLTSAGGPITFLPKLPPAWIVKVDKEIPKKDGVSGHIVVVQNTNQTTSVTIMLIPYPQARADKDFEQTARNHFGGLLDKWRGQTEDEKFAVNKANGRDNIAQASCHIRSSNGALYFSGKCWLSKNRLVSCTALRKDASEEKEIEAIGNSIQVAD